MLTVCVKCNIVFAGNDFVSCPLCKSERRAEKLERQVERQENEIEDLTNTIARMLQAQ